LPAQNTYTAVQGDIEPQKFWGHAQWHRPAGPVVFGGLADVYGVDLSLLMLAVLTSLTLFSGKVLMKSVPLNS
jgi:hypothetical protein